MDKNMGSSITKLLIITFTSESFYDHVQHVARQWIVVLFITRRNLQVSELSCAL